MAGNRRSWEVGIAAAALVGIILFLSMCVGLRLHP